MKINAILLTLLLVPNLSAKHNQVNPQPKQESIELQKQEEEDNTKIKLALIAAAVSLVVVLKGKDDAGITLFEQILAFIWKK